LFGVHCRDFILYQSVVVQCTGDMNRNDCSLFRFMNSVIFSQVVLTYRRLSFVIISNVLAFKQLIATCYICRLLYGILHFHMSRGRMWMYFVVQLRTLAYNFI